MKKSATAGDGKTAVVSAKSRGTLSARVSSWFDQRSRHALILQAQHQAETDAATPAEPARRDRKSIQRRSGRCQRESVAIPACFNLGRSSQTRHPRGPPATSPHPLRRACHPRRPPRHPAPARPRLRQVGRPGRSPARHRPPSHVALPRAHRVHRLLAVIAIALVEVFVNRASPSSQEAATERRRLHTLRTIADLAIEVVAVLLVLLVVFGAPSQMPTILGLATAGVTVVFQDFILAFFGWFVLMGRNGIRVGDWVEINSVGGEVVEIGLFRTTLMETGNWTDKGHPTGRRVTFINNFAITGQFFNFSTVGQWMWDEIAITIPAGDAAFATIEAIRQRVIAETSRDAHLAEAEWQHATTQQSLSQFTASPSVDLRPAAAGIDIIVRYVTRAGDRFEMRNRIYQAMIDILHLQPEALPAPNSK